MLGNRDVEKELTAFGSKGSNRSSELSDKQIAVLQQKIISKVRNPVNNYCFDHQENVASKMWPLLREVSRWRTETLFPPRLRASARNNSRISRTSQHNRVPFFSRRCGAAKEMTGLRRGLRSVKSEADYFFFFLVSFLTGFFGSGAFLGGERVGSVRCPNSLSKTSPY